MTNITKRYNSDERNKAICHNIVNADSKPIRPVLDVRYFY